MGRARRAMLAMLLALASPACALDRVSLEGGPVDASSPRPSLDADLARRDASTPVDGAPDGGSDDAGVDAGELDAGPDAGLHETHVIECESGTLHGQTEITASTEASGGSYTDDTRGTSWDADGTTLPADRVDFAITLTQPGPFHLWVRIHASDPSRDAQYAGFSPTDLRRFYPEAYGSWEWVHVVDGDASTLRFDALAPGAQVLSIGTGEPGPRCDRVVLTNDPAFDPSTLR